MSVPSRLSLATLAALIAAATIVAAAPDVRELRWAGDAEGGAPFVEASPAHPGEVVGFDVEIAGLMAKGIGRTPHFIMITFTSIDQSIDRDDADIGMSGIEDTPARRATRAVTIPYYEFREVLSGAGLSNVEIQLTHRVHEFAGSAIVRAVKPLA